MRPPLLIGLLLFLTACGTIQVATPAPTPEAIQIIYPSTLQPWADDLSGCAGGNPLVALYFTQSISPDPGSYQNAIGLWFGNLASGSKNNFLSQVGKEQVVVVVNAGNSISQLSAEQLHSVFSGQGTMQPLQVWVFPEGDPTRTLFDSVVLQSTPVTSEAMLAPDPAAMLESVSKNPDAIGYLPKSILTTADPALAGKLKTVQLEPALAADLFQPVIAVTPSEPMGFMRSLLVCLETKKR